MTDISEPVFVQTFMAKAPINTFNKSVLGRRAGLDMSQLNSIYTTRYGLTPCP